MASHNAPQALTDDEFRSEVKSLVEEAFSHIDTRIRSKREDNWRRFHGKVDAQPQNGGSDIKVMTIQDSVMTILPEVLDVFMSADQIAEFLPSTHDPVEGEVCSSANLAVKSAFWNEGGWIATHDSVFEAITSGYGFYKVYRKQVINTTVDEDYMTIDQVLVHKSKGADVRPLWDVNAPSSVQENDQNLGRYAVTTQETIDDIVIEAVPASNMVWTYSHNFKDAWLVGQFTETRIGELMKMGFSKDHLKDLTTTSYSASKIRSEENTRENNNSSNTDKQRFSANSWASKKISYGEVYAHIDKDGDGIAEVYKIWVAGDAYTVLDYEPAKKHPFILVPGYRIPHSTYSTGIADSTKEFQEAETRVLRAQVDLAELLAGPMILNAIGSGVDENKLAVWKSMKVIACRSPEAVKWLVPPDVGQSILGTAQELKMRREDRVGVPRIGSSLRPEDMADIAATVATAAAASSEKKIAYLARVQAEMALKELMKAILEIIVEMGTFKIYIDGQVIPINTTQFNPEWKLRAKVGLGTGTRLERAATMQQLYTVLEGACTKLGPDNPITDLEKLHNLIYDFGCAQPGINISRYVKASPETKQLLDKLKNQPPPPDPAMVKAQADIKANEAKIQATMQLREQELQQKMQLKQQEINQDFQLGVMEIQVEAQLDAIAIEEQGKTDRAVGNAEIARDK